jgi:hypothetical protein
LLGEYGSHCSPAIWNQYENKGHRTNNAVEGFHSKMNKILKPHSDIFTVIKYFQDEDLEMSNIYAKIKQGNLKTKEPPKAERDKEEQLF